MIPENSGGATTMSKSPGEDEINPYAAPDVAIGPDPIVSTAELAHAERVRRKYLNHEASVRAIGSLNLLGAIVLGIAAVAFVFAIFAPNRGAGESFGAGTLIGFAVLVAVLAGLNGAIGIGLRNLQPWARWVNSVVLGLGIGFSLLAIILAALAGGNVGGAVGQALVQQIIPGYILYLMLSKKGAIVFSPEYREIVEKTPHIKYQTSCLVKGLLYTLLAIIGLAIIGGVIGYFSRR
jgi:hypothetical protein